MASATSSNVARLVDCSSDPTLVGTLISELPGTPPHTSPVRWNVENKYYSATILLHTHHWEMEWEEGTAACEAVIMLCSLTVPESLQRAQKSWEKMSVAGASPGVCLLVAAWDSSGSGLMDEAVSWSVEHGFELVEWTPASTSQHSEEDEDSGIERVSMAMQAHVWPEMKMKEGTPSSRPSGDSTFSDQLTRPGGAAQLDDITAEQILARGLDVEDSTEEGEESFEELFSRFAAMKVHAQSLPHEERKAYAEKVVMAFWDAIGGDEREVKSDTDSS